MLTNSVNIGFVKTNVNEVMLTLVFQKTNVNIS